MNWYVSIGSIQNPLIEAADARGRCADAECQCRYRSADACGWEQQGIVEYNNGGAEADPDCVGLRLRVEHATRQGGS